MPRRRRVLHYREVPPYFIEPSPPEGATRSARRPAVVVLQPFFAKRLFETSDFRKRNRRWERNRRRVDCGMHATAYACIPDGGGWSGGVQPSLSFSRLGRVKTPRKKIVCPTQTPAPGLPPRPPVLRRARIPRLTSAPSLVYAPQGDPNIRGPSWPVRPLRVLWCEILLLA